MSRAFAPAYVEARAQRGRHGNPDRLSRRKENAGAVGLGRRGLAPRVVDGEGDGQSGRYLHQVGDEAKTFRDEGDLLCSVAGGNED
jgi:hypothetical protein